MVRCSPHHSRSVILAEAIEYARPFDQNLGSPLIYFFYLHTTIRLKYMALFHLIFLLCTTIRPRLSQLGSSLAYFFICTRPFDKKCIVLFHLFFLLFTTIRPKLGSSLIYFFYLYTTIQPNYMVLFHLFFLYFVHDHSTKNQGPHFICTRPFDRNLGPSLINLFHLYTTIRPKIKVPINLMFLYTTIQPKIWVLINLFLFAYNHSTKNYGPHYFFYLRTNIQSKLGVTLTL